MRSPTETKTAERLHSMAIRLGSGMTGSKPMSELGEYDPKRVNKLVYGLNNTIKEQAATIERLTTTLGD
jgi:hypothetical protein